MYVNREKRNIFTPELPRRRLARRWRISQPSPRSGARRQPGRFRFFGFSRFPNYEISDRDGSAPRTMSGKELMETGLTVEIKTQPGSAVILYKKR